MNDRSRISPCGIYRRGTDVPRARRRICLNYFISYDFLLSVSPSAIRARALSHRERTSELATSFPGGKKYTRSRLIFSLAKEIALAYRSAISNPQHRTSFDFHEGERKVQGDLFQTHICLLLRLTVFTKLERTIFYRKHREPFGNLILGINYLFLVLSILRGERNSSLATIN